MNFQHVNKRRILTSIHKIIIDLGFTAPRFHNVQELYKYLITDSSLNNTGANIYTKFSDINSRMSDKKELSCLEVFLHSLIHICSIDRLTKNIIIDSVNLNWVLDWILIDYLASREGINYLALGEILEEFYFLLCNDSSSKASSLILYILEVMQTSNENQLINIDQEIQRLQSSIDPRLRNDNFFLDKSIVKKVEHFYTTRYFHLSNVIKIKFITPR
jgi:hypothetical protein